MPNDLTCLLQSPTLCNEALKQGNLIFWGAVTQKVIKVIEEAFSEVGGFCALPFLDWQSHFMIPKEEKWGGAIIGIQAKDMYHSIMKGLSADEPQRLFIALKTEPSVVTTLFQDRANDDHYWHLGTPNLKHYIYPTGKHYFVGPFDSLPPKGNEVPVCELTNGCLDLLSDLAHSGTTTIEHTYRASINGTEYISKNNMTYSLV